jgi:hypothetical protein
LQDKQVNSTFFPLSSVLLMSPSFAHVEKKISDSGELEIQAISEDQLLFWIIMLETLYSQVSIMNTDSNQPIIKRMKA